MNNKKILILLSAILLLMTSCSLFQLIEWGFEDKKDNSIYPSAVLALAGYDENNEVDVQNSKRNQSIRVLKDYVSIYLVPKDDNTKIEIEVKESEYWYASKAVFTCDKADDRYIYKPVINWKYDVLRKLNQPTPVNMVVQLIVNGEDAGERSKTLNLRSINECVFAMRDGEKLIDFNMLFAAYVNEDHPLIQQILKEGLETGIIKSYKGYQGGKEMNVYAQVLSIWNALEIRGIHYSNLIESSQSSPVYFSQRVRTIEEALTYSQANCVDGTVLFASLLKAIGIDPVLVRVPGHMFLGFYVNRKHTKMEFLETTLLGTEETGLKEELTQFLGVESYDSFIKAIEKGKERYEQYKDSATFIMIDIKEIRKYIKPIGM
ncbi:MAG: hypothetical protein PHQ11_13455 [Paludibacter sp.]|nr:hypothetical protein [Paludibacter sp.]